MLAVDFQGILVHRTSRHVRHHKIDKLDLYWLLALKNSNEDII